MDKSLPACDISGQYILQNPDHREIPKDTNLLRLKLEKLHVVHQVSCMGKTRGLQDGAESQQGLGDHKSRGWQGEEVGLGWECHMECTFGRLISFVIQQMLMCRPPEMVQTTKASLPGVGLQLCTFFTPWPQGGRVEGHGRAALSRRFQDQEKNQ